MRTELGGYDAWKTRSDLDDADRHAVDHRQRCFLCDAPLPAGCVPWSFWCSDQGSASLCDDCAPNHPDRDEP